MGREGRALFSGELSAREKKGDKQEDRKNILIDYRPMKKDVGWDFGDRTVKR